MIFENGLSIWLKIGIVIFLIMIVIFLFGIVANELFKIGSKTLLGVYVWGFVLFLALEEMVYIPCFFLKINFKVFSFMMGIVYLFTIIYGIILLFQKRLVSTWYSANRNKEGLGYLLTFVVIILAVSYYVISRRWIATYDDKYYLAKAGEIIKNLNISPMLSEAADGVIEEGTYSRADMSSLIVLYAFVSAMTSIHYVIVARIVFSFLVIVFGIAIISEIGLNVFGSRKMTLIFTLIAIPILTYFKSVPTYQPEMWWFMLPWYGIPIIAFIGYLYILVIFQLYKEEYSVEDIRFWLIMILLNMAILETEIVAAFIIPCLYVTYGLTYFIFNRDKVSIKVFIYAILSLIPEIISGIYILFSYWSSESSAVGQNMGYDYSRVIYDSFLWGGLNVYIYFGVFLISFFYLLFCIDSKIKKAFILPCFTLGLTFANPLLFNIVCRYITTQAVYYRIFFCVPVFIIISIALCDIFSKNGKGVKITIIVGLLVVLCINIRRMINTEKINNPYKATSIGIILVEELLSLSDGKDVQVVAPHNISHELRVYSPNIIFTCSVYSSKMLIPGTTYTYVDLCDAVYDKQQETLNVLKYLGTDYVIFPSDMELPKEYQYHNKIEIDKYIIVDINS